MRALHSALAGIALVLLTRESGYAGCQLPNSAGEPHSSVADLPFESWYFRNDIGAEGNGFARIALATTAVCPSGSDFSPAFLIIADCSPSGQMYVLAHPGMRGWGDVAEVIYTFDGAQPRTEFWALDRNKAVLAGADAHAFLGQVRASRELEMVVYTGKFSRRAKFDLLDSEAAVTTLLSECRASDTP